MLRHTSRMLAPILALFACLFFVLAGQAFISLLGIEDDESLFAAPLLRPQFWSFALKIGHRRAPLMVMTYIGTVKTAFYAVLFRLFSPGVWSVREPMLLAGGASIWVFYLLLRRTAGRRAAVLGAVLLA